MFAVRTPFRHTVLHRPNTFGRDDYVDGLYLQGSTQWDALKHISHPVYGFYNGADDARIDADTALLGVHGFAAAGIVGRAVLLDVERFLAARGEVLRPDARREITAAELEAVAAAAGVSVGPGDILLLRTGVARLVHAEGAAPARAVRPYPGGPGLAANDEMLAWLWDHQVAAVVSDNLTVEAFPMGPGSLHRSGIALLGLVLGELFDLEALAADCAQDGQFACLFVAKPLNLRGGVGSPGNALALK
jgi:kynurenine formamidase